LKKKSSSIRDLELYSPNNAYRFIVENKNNNNNTRSPVRDLKVNSLNNADWLAIETKY
jgi:hypothetical protein